MAEDYRETVKRLALDPATFIQLTMKGKVRGGVETPWRMIAVRQVMVKGRRHLQFSYYDAKQHVVKNALGEEAEARLDEALAIPFSSVVVQTTEQTLRVQLTKKGHAILHRDRAAPDAPPPDLTHDRRKQLPLPDGKPDPFLQAIGIMDAQGRVRPRMRDKFAQINEFLKLLEHTGEIEALAGAAQGRPLRLLDGGCGAAHLTLAVYHYLNDVRGVRCTLVGVDSDEALIEKSRADVEAMGLADVCFAHSAIIDYAPAAPPDIVLALHACDTATDEAIAQGIRWGARLILCAPCCHHHLHRQLETAAPFAPVMRHGILKKRLGDLLTDAFRALVLRIMGYRTDVVEFVASEHTDRNLMIRAVRAGAVPGADAFAREYHDLKAFWGVTPYLETLLGEEFRGRLG